MPNLDKYRFVRKEVGSQKENPLPKWQECLINEVANGREYFVCKEGCGMTRIMFYGEGPEQHYFIPAEETENAKLFGPFADAYNFHEVELYGPIALVGKYSKAENAENPTLSYFFINKDGIEVDVSDPRKLKNGEVEEKELIELPSRASARMGPANVSRICENIDYPEWLELNPAISEKDRGAILNEIYLGKDEERRGHPSGSRRPFGGRFLWDQEHMPGASPMDITERKNPAVAQDQPGNPPKKQDEFVISMENPELARLLALGCGFDQIKIVSVDHTDCDDQNDWIVRFIDHKGGYHLAKGCDILKLREHRDCSIVTVDAIWISSFRKLPKYTSLLALVCEEERRHGAYCFYFISGDLKEIFQIRLSESQNFKDMHGIDEFKRIADIIKQIFEQAKEQGGFEYTPDDINDLIMGHEGAAPFDNQFLGNHENGEENRQPEMLWEEWVVSLAEEAELVDPDMPTDVQDQAAVQTTTGTDTPDQAEADRAEIFTSIDLDEIFDAFEEEKEVIYFVEGQTLYDNIQMLKLHISMIGNGPSDIAAGNIKLVSIDSSALTFFVKGRGLFCIQTEVIKRYQKDPPWFEQAKIYEANHWIGCFESRPYKGGKMIMTLELRLGIFYLGDIDGNIWEPDKLDFGLYNTSSWQEEDITRNLARLSEAMAREYGECPISPNQYPILFLALTSRIRKANDLGVRRQEFFAPQADEHNEEKETNETEADPFKELKDHVRLEIRRFSYEDEDGCQCGFIDARNLHFVNSFLIQHAAQINSITCEEDANEIIRIFNEEKLKYKEERKIGVKDGSATLSDKFVRRRQPPAAPRLADILRKDSFQDVLEAEGMHIIDTAIYIGENGWKWIGEANVSSEKIAGMTNPIISIKIVKTRDPKNIEMLFIRNVSGGCLTIGPVLAIGKFAYVRRKSWQTEVRNGDFMTLIRLCGEGGRMEFCFISNIGVVEKPHILGLSQLAKIMMKWANPEDFKEVLKELLSPEEMDEFLQSKKDIFKLKEELAAKMGIENTLRGFILRVLNSEMEVAISLSDSKINLDQLVEILMKLNEIKGVQLLEEHIGFLKGGGNEILIEAGRPNLYRILKYDSDSILRANGNWLTASQIKAMLSSDNQIGARLLNVQGQIIDCCVYNSKNPSQNENMQFTRTIESDFFELSLGRQVEYIRNVFDINGQSQAELLEMKDRNIGKVVFFVETEMGCNLVIADCNKMQIKIQYEKWIRPREYKSMNHLAMTCISNGAWPPKDFDGYIGLPEKIIKGNSNIPNIVNNRMIREAEKTYGWKVVEIKQILKLQGFNLPELLKLAKISMDAHELFSKGNLLILAQRRGLFTFCIAHSSGEEGLLEVRQLTSWFDMTRLAHYCEAFSYPNPIHDSKSDKPETGSNQSRMLYSSRTEMSEFTNGISISVIDLTFMDKL
ncbi:MAG: hypothetical protein NTZ80_02540 [Patescibacteria group bacterium]|nr:hypothetical protein [Patescibacteria group bacterium]